MFSNLFGGIFDSSTVTVIPVYQFLLCVVVSLLLESCLRQPIHINQNIMQDL